MSLLELWLENNEQKITDEVLHDPYSEDIMGAIQQPWVYWNIPLGIMWNVTIQYGNETFSLLELEQQS